MSALDRVHKVNRTLKMNRRKYKLYTPDLSLEFVPFNKQLSNKIIKMD